MLVVVTFYLINVSGLWMFTGMALRMVIELGLHRERGCLDVDQPPAEIGNHRKDDQARSSSKEVTLEEFEKSSQIILFWIVFTLDTALSNGTGRVPGLKRHEINVRLPTDGDIANVRAGPGRNTEPIRPEVFPHTARMMLIYAQCLDFLNTGSRQIRFQPRSDSERRMDRIEELKSNLIREYRLVPKELGFGANCYQAAVKAGQAGPYLLLHLQCYLQIAFLTQESLAGEEEAAEIPPSRNITDEDRKRGLELRKVNRESYRNAIKSITDMLTFAKLIDNRALLSTVYLNQAFFHGACAYSRDMFPSNKGKHSSDTQVPLCAFPIPSQTSPSMVFNFEDCAETPHNLGSRNGSDAATESTYSFLSLIAKANYRFLRQAIKDQARYYAGSGWVDAVLDQRGKGLRDVDLSIISESVSTFIRLHDLCEPGGSQTSLKKVVPPSMGNVDQEKVVLDQANGSWAELPYDFLADTELNFDPQAFFDDYMFTGGISYQSR